MLLDGLLLSVLVLLCSIGVCIALRVMTFAIQVLLALFMVVDALICLITANVVFYVICFLDGMYDILTSTVGFTLWIILALVIAFRAYTLPSESIVLMLGVQFGQTTSTAYMWVRFCLLGNGEELACVGTCRLLRSYLSNNWEYYTIRYAPEFALLYGFCDVIDRIRTELVYSLVMIIKDVVQFFRLL